MAEQVIEELETAFKQLRAEATSLIKASKTNEYREDDGRVNDDFLARYFTMRKTELRNYERLISELRSMQDEDAKTYLEEEAAFTCTPMFHALMGKLNFIVNGDVPPSPTPQPAEDNEMHNDHVDERETPQRRTSPQRYNAARHGQPFQLYREQETHENERTGYNDFPENRNNNNRPAKRSTRAPVPVSEVDRSYVNLLRKPEVKVDTFKGDALSFSRFVRQLESRVFPHCEDDEEKLTYLEQYTEGEPKRIVTSFAHLSAKGFQYAMRELQDRYGNPVVVSNHYLNKVLGFKSFKIDDVKSLDEFSMLLNECECATGSNGCLETLSSVSNMQAMLKKLPIQLQDRFNRKAVNLQHEGRTVEFFHLVQFIRDEARLVKNSPYGREALHGAQNANTGSSSSQAYKQGTPNRFSKHRTNAAVASTVESKVSDRKVFKKFCKHCSGEHWPSKKAQIEIDDLVK